MDHRTLACRPVTAFIALGLSLLAPRAGQANLPDSTPPFPYKIQPIVQLGAPVGDITLSSKSGSLALGSLNDQGQILFAAQSTNAGYVLLQYSDSQFTPIVVGGADAPGGQWRKTTGITAIGFPVSMNEQGSAVFVAPILLNNKNTYGTFLWDAQARQVTAIAQTGMPATGNLTFTAGGEFTPVINNHDQAAFSAYVKGPDGKDHLGTFLWAKGQSLKAIALPGQPLPDGTTVEDAWLPSIDDAGRVAFRSDHAKPLAADYYLWDNGAIAPILRTGDLTPGGDKVVLVSGAWLNNTNRSVLLQTVINKIPTQAVYLWSAGALQPVAVDGQEMPGGGQFKGLTTNEGGASYANEAGQYAFVAQLKDNSTAAYRVDAEGNLSLILQTGMMTDPGKITQIGSFQGDQPSSIAINSKGQIAVVVRIDQGKDTLVLLTPTGP